MNDVLIIFRDAFARRVVEFATAHGIVFDVVRSFHDISVTSLPDHPVTFVGAPQTFSYAVLDEIAQLPIPSSIITALNDISLRVQLRRLASCQPLLLRDVYIRDFTSSASPDDGSQRDDSIDSVRAADAVFLTTHGDVLCASLRQGVLCARDTGSQISQKETTPPACALSQQCFRRRRFGNTGTFVHVQARELTAKLIFLNTCGAIGMTGTKYGEYSNRLAITLLQHSAAAVISSFAIKHTYPGEMYIFYALLARYRSPSIATFLLNRIMYNVTGRASTMIMLGAACVRLADSNVVLEPARINTLEAGDCLMLDVGVLAGHVLAFSIRRRIHHVLSGSVENIAVCSETDVWHGIACYEYGDADYLHVIGYRKEPHQGRVQLLILDKTALRRSSVQISRRVGLLAATKYLRLAEPLQSTLAHRQSDLAAYSAIITGFVRTNDITGTTVAAVARLLRTSQSSVLQLERSFVSSIVTHSMASDTALLLEESRLLIRSEMKRMQQPCFICGNRTYETVYGSPVESMVRIRQTICPRCEILSIRTWRAAMVRVLAPTCIRPGAALSVQIGFPRISQRLAVHIGVALINTGAGIVATDLELDKRETWPVSLPVPQHIPPGLYYVRVAFVTDGGFSITHRHLYVEGG